MRKTRSRNEGFPGDHIGPVRGHTLVYTVVPASVLVVFSDLSRFASLGIARIFHILSWPCRCIGVRFTACDMRSVQRPSLCCAGL